MYNSNGYFGLSVVNKTIATQENLLDIHECINLHLCHEKPLSKIEILNYLILLNNMEFPNLELQMVAQYAENICIDILKTLNKEGSLQDDTLEMFKKDSVESAGRTSKELCDNIIFNIHDTKTSSLLFPSQSTAGVLQSDFTLKRSASLNLTCTEKMLDIQQNVQFDNNTLQIPSEMLTNKDFEENFQDLTTNCNTVTCKDPNNRYEDIENSVSSDQTDIYVEEKKFVDNDNNRQENEHFSIKTNNTLCLCYDDEQTDHSFVFDLDDGNCICTKLFEDDINKDIDKISDKLKGSVILNDNDSNILINGTPNQSINTEVLLKSKSQSMSLLNIYRNSYKKKHSSSRFFDSRMRLKKPNVIKNSESSALDFLIDGSTNVLPKNFRNHFTGFHETGSIELKDFSISQNKVVINGSEVVNTQEVYSQDIYAKYIEDRKEQAAQQRTKYREKWKNMPIEEKVNMKFIKKFDINIFEAPVDILVNIDYKMKGDHFYFPRITNQEMNDRLKHCNIQILVDTLVRSIKEAINRKLFQEISMENSCGIESSDEDNESDWLKDFVEQSKLGYINKRNLIKNKFGSVNIKDFNTAESLTEPEDNRIENNEKDLSVLVRNLEDFSWLN
ncbi:uncharacterized protein LOC143193274 isoform X2 [Rhynchophorus ferrugineus]|uniref:uncharacterized protein LOC143193274 isoform X2 n=1 Tax=Rhynchophorus ferrugineus TaxID=354439 RepID=UPI003FCDB680